MSLCGSSEEDYLGRRLRRIQQDINQGTFADWVTKERVVAKRMEMDHNVREEVRRTSSRRQEETPAVKPRPSVPVFDRTVNPFCHPVPGTTPPHRTPDLSPLIAEAHRVTDQFFEDY